ncbi:MAG: NAD-dependent epimerase/dehydratase family protein [Gemmatimonadota bacterium]
MAALPNAFTVTRLLLTGGTGFLGSHLAEAFVGAGYDVVASVRATSDTRWLDPLGVETTTIDLGRAEEADLTRLLESVDSVVHCGGLTRARRETEFMAVNAIGTECLARAAERAGVRRFVFISSLAARGPDGAGAPESPYGRSKAEAERRLSKVAKRMEAVVLRPGGVYGPRDSDLLPMFEMAAKGWVVVPRNAPPLQPVYVSDVVAATVAAVTADPPEGPLPIAHGETHTWLRLAKALADAVGRPGRVVPVPPGVFWAAGLVSEIWCAAVRKTPAMDRRKARDLSRNRWTCDITGTQRSLAWSAEVDIGEGLAKTAAWYRESGWL